MYPMGPGFFIFFQETTWHGDSEAYSYKKRVKVERYLEKIGIEKPEIVEKITECQKKEVANILIYEGYKPTKAEISHLCKLVVAYQKAKQEEDDEEVMMFLV